MKNYLMDSLQIWTYPNIFVFFNLSIKIIEIHFLNCKSSRYSINLILWNYKIAPKYNTKIPHKIINASLSVIASKRELESYLLPIEHHKLLYKTKLGKNNGTMISTKTTSAFPKSRSNSKTAASMRTATFSKQFKNHK